MFVFDSISIATHIIVIIIITIIIEEEEEEIWCNFPASLLQFAEATLVSHGGPPL